MELACAGDAGVNTKSPLPPVAYRLKYAREETPASDEVDGLRGVVCTLADSARSSLPMPVVNSASDYWSVFCFLPVR